MLKITVTTDVVTFPIRVTPRAKRNAVTGIVGDAFKVTVTAPPEDGRANDAVIEMLAKRLRVKRRQVEIISGATSRNKVVCVSGTTSEDVANKLLVAQ